MLVLWSYFWTRNPQVSMILIYSTTVQYEPPPPFTSHSLTSQTVAFLLSLGKLEKKNYSLAGETTPPHFSRLIYSNRTVIYYSIADFYFSWYLTPRLPRQSILYQLKHNPYFTVATRFSDDAIKVLQVQRKHEWPYMLQSPIYKVLSISSLISETAR